MNERKDIATYLTATARRIAVTAVNMLAAVVLTGVAMLAVACSGSDDSANGAGNDSQQHATQQQPQAVDFNAYVNRSTTRGGTPGTLDLTALQTAGFGVYAYYTDNHQYNQMSLPNFMFNQQVQYDALSTHQWTYSPMKYWPNETGTDAISTGIDYLTFFAYAPYTAVDPATGCCISDTETGIIRLSHSHENGDPLVTYRVSFEPAKRVDLCWAVPTLNKAKPTISETVDFNFQHALAALNVQIDADIDVASHAASSLHENTRVWVRSITFEGFAEQGQLSMYSTTRAHWYGMDCDCAVSSKPITVYDGRRDSHEGVAASPNEQPTGLNPVIVQSTAYTVTETTITAPAATEGVTNTPVNLFDVNDVTGTDAQKLAAPIFVIPSNDPMRVTIEYDVETYDPKLVTDRLADNKTTGSSICNRLTTAITSGGTSLTMQAGKQYNIRLHLGLTSVKVDASVQPWGESYNVIVEFPNESQ